MPPLPLDGAFTALLLLITGASAGSVLPPANVSASCSGLNVTVSWEYSMQRPQTSFLVEILGSEGKYESVTTEHQYDLSHFVWASERHALDFYSVNVTAVEGGNKSKQVASKSFSFNRLKPAKIKCKLDFPPVDLTDTDSGATVSFMNPLHFYGALKRLDTGTLTFKSSSSDASGFDGSCTAQDINCKLDVRFPKDEEKCLSLTGRLGAKNEYGGFEFRETGRICAVASSELHVVTLTVSLFVLAIVCSVIAIIVCKVKAWTLKTPDPPQTLTSQLQNRKEGGKYAPVSPADISPLTFAPYKKPSISSEEGGRDLAEYPRGGGAPRDFQPPAGPYAEGGLSDGYRRGDESGDDSQKTETISMDSEEDVSPYDRPHTLQVDMGDGDVVTGYSER